MEANELNEVDAKKRKIGITTLNPNEELVAKMESPQKDTKTEQTNEDDVEFMTSHLNDDVVIWSSNHKV